MSRLLRAAPPSTLRPLTNTVTTAIGTGTTLTIAACGMMTTLRLQTIAALAAETVASTLPPQESVMQEPLTVKVTAATGTGITLMLAAPMISHMYSSLTMIAAPAAEARGWFTLAEPDWLLRAQRPLCKLSLCVFVYVYSYSGLLCELGSSR